MLDSFRRGCLLPIASYAINTHGEAAPVPVAPRQHGRYEAWLGYWDPSLNGLNTDSIVVRACFNSARCSGLGNDVIANRLAELAKLERALNLAGEAEVCHEEVRYAKAAAAVQACSFTITTDHTRDQLEQLLPYVGPVIAGIITELARLQWCGTLQHLHSNKPVADSSGRIRPDSGGAQARMGFCKLPGVGPVTAKEWYELGCLTLNDVWLRREELQVDRRTTWALERRADLTESVSHDEQTEMEEEVLSALEASSGMRGWQLTLVGGGRRGKPSHDIDFLVHHPEVHEQDTSAFMDRCIDTLVARGRLVRSEHSLCIVQRGKLKERLDSIQRNLLQPQPRGTAGGSRRIDGYDHIFGVYLTRASKHRRLDLIFVPHSSVPYAMLGWTGSRQYLRFLKTYATNRKMTLNSHGLWNHLTGKLLPAKSEADIFTHLGLEYREPADRNCP